MATQQLASNKTLSAKGRVCRKSIFSTKSKTSLCDSHIPNIEKGDISVQYFCALDKI